MDKILPIFLFCSFLSDNISHVTFKAASNDLAEISLSLDESHQLTLVFKPLEEMKKYTFKGKWEIINGFYELTFLKEKSGEPDLKDVFEDTRGRVTVINNQKVTFRETESKIRIWGILCLRQ